MTETASRERVAEVLYLHDQSRALIPRPWGKASDLTKYRYTEYADALLGAGVFRDEAEVKAEALDEAAEHIIIPRASSLAAAWLQGSATKLRGSGS